MTTIAITMLLALAAPAPESMNEDIWAASSGPSPRGRIAPRKSTPASRAASVMLKASAEVQGRVVRVSDVAELSGDEGLCARLAGLPLASAPRPGNVRVLSRAQIAAAVRRLASGSTVSGAEAVSVRTATQVVAGDALRRMATREILARFPGQPDRLEVEFVSATRPVEVTKGKLSFNLNMRPPGSWGRSRASALVNIDILVNGTREAGVVIPVRLRIFGLVPVASRGIERGQALVQEDVSCQRTELIGRAVRAMALDRYLGWTTRRRIPSGAVLTADMFRAPILVHRGDQVTTELRTDTITVVARAVALEDGSLGSTIRLRLKGSRKDFPGRVTGAREATVE